MSQELLCFGARDHNGNPISLLLRILSCACLWSSNANDDGDKVCGDCNTERELLCRCIGVLCKSGDADAVLSNAPSGDSVVIDAGVEPGAGDKNPWLAFSVECSGEAALCASCIT